MSDEDRRHDSDMRRLFERIEAQEKAINAAVLEMKLFMATRDMEFKALKTEQDEIAKNQKCIIDHLNRFKAWMFAGSIVVVVLFGLGKGVFWLYENAPQLLEDMFKNAK